jgi:hypothetical protein
MRNEAEKIDNQQNNEVLSCADSVPDYTLVWYVIDNLCTSKKISYDAKIEVFTALIKLESEGKCTMGDLTDWD